MSNDKPAEIVIDDEDISEVAALPQADEHGNGPDGKPIDWEAQAKQFQGMATRRGTKLQKLKTAPKPAADKPVDQAPKTGELGYAEKAYLNSLGYKDADEQQVFQDAMKATGRTLDQVAGDQFVIGQIEGIRKDKATKDATPGRSDRQTPPARDSVEYWLNKGEMPPNTPENKKLREDIVNAKLKKAKSGSMFAEQAVVQ